jgi:conjugative transfer signal peptidase TraF
MKKRVCIAVSAWCLFAALHGAVNAPLVINVSSSVPRGVYLKKKGGNLERGNLVLVCPSNGAVWRLVAQSRSVVKGSGCGGTLAPLIKEIAAVEGDTVTVTTAGVVLNGTLRTGTALLSFSSRGKPLPQASSQKIPRGELFLLGSSPESLDSRYFGTIPIRDVQGVLTRIL